MAERGFKEGILCKETVQKLYQEHGTKEEPKESKPISEESDQTIKLPPYLWIGRRMTPTRAELYVKLSITTDEALQDIW